jgi:hypothetical protein
MMWVYKCIRLGLFFGVLLAKKRYAVEMAF